MSLMTRFQEANKQVDLPPHLIIEAGAGCGKTTTLVDGLKVLRGLPTNITPSPQQKAIWDAMALSIPKDQTKFEGKTCFVAFNKSIATELQRRVPKDVEAMTMHSLGYKAVTTAFGRIAPEGGRVQNNLSKYLKRDIWDIRRKSPELVGAVEDAVKFCKMNLVGTFEELELAQLIEIASVYDIPYDGDWRYFHELVSVILKMSLDVDEDRMIDYNDQVWLPVALQLPMPKYDLLLIDEAQDLNRCQHALTFKAGRRLIYCGDPKQAIYAFTGADCKSMDSLFKELSTTHNGCDKLFLTVTRRCAKSIVKKVNRLVPSLEAHEDNVEGKTTDATVKEYQAQVQAGDMVLCRCNAPLVTECFRLLAQKRLCKIQGRDIGQSLVRTINSLKATTVPELIGKLEDWHDKQRTKETAKKFPNEDRLRALQDRLDCILIFCNEPTVKAVIESIQDVFTDKASEGAILCSSIHKAKGLEAKRVFLLRLKEAKLPHPMAKTPEAKEQERNLEYVAETRAIEELVTVHGTFRGEEE
jgi:superfamily I DNA/RNA helicase